MMVSRKTWLSPAKLNLFLHITGRRSDGYHLLQTVFQFLNYSDELRFDIRNDGLIRLETVFEGVEHEDNLIVRAAQLLKPYCKNPQYQGVSIQIEKRLPMGGGLGGGSSNAATTLVALNTLWDLGLGTDELALLGLSLGADVPVFIHGYAAWAEGVGENLMPIELPERWFTVVSPGVEVSTGKIFSHEQLTRNCSAIRIRDFLGGHATQNVCQPIVTSLYPTVAKALKLLDTTSPVGEARMTGTGSCVFAGYPDKARAEDALSVLPDDWTAFVAKAQNQSPLYAVN